MTGFPSEWQRTLGRYAQLKHERSSYDPHWAEISRIFMPRNGRFITSDRNRGERRHNNILDSSGTRALRVLGAGMMSGATSPARPWFRLSTGDTDLNAYQPVQIWLSNCTRTMRAIFGKSNTYRTLHGMYEELGGFGTAASILGEDFDNVIHHYHATVGEFCIATDWRGNVNTIYREFDKTVYEVVSEFGLENCSSRVKDAYNRGNLDRWVTILHAIEPRLEREHGKRDAKNMAFRSVYIEQGAPEGKYLRESGYRRFPALVPRWSVIGGDVYGDSPGMEALGDGKQLQHEQLRKGQVIDYQTQPPLQIPSNMKNNEVDTLPGGVTYVDMNGNGAKIQSAFDVNLRLDYLLADIVDVRGRINETFYSNLFLMLANSTDTRMTATEVAERHEEKLLVLGPVIERLHNELLEPLIDNTFARMMEAGIVPTPPPELQGMDLNVEFVSVLAQAQRAIQTNSIDRFVASLGTIAQMKPGVLDKLDEDRWVDSYADALGIDPEMIVSSDKVALIRQQRAQAQAQAQQAEMVSQGAQAARNMAAAKTDSPSVLTNVMDMFSGYNS